MKLGQAVLLGMVAVGVVLGLFWRVLPTDEEENRWLERSIAACRTMGGEPHLSARVERVQTRFFFESCWLSKP